MSPMSQIAYMIIYALTLEWHLLLSNSSNGLMLRIINKSSRSVKETTMRRTETSVVSWRENKRYTEI